MAGHEAARAEEEGVMKKPFCVLIQWGPGKAMFALGKPVCPRCGDEAEEIVAIHGGPGYAHKPAVVKRKRETRRSRQTA
jgi:hypothetical protein